MVQYTERVDNLLPSVLNPILDFHQMMEPIFKAITALIEIPFIQHGNSNKYQWFKDETNPDDSSTFPFSQIGILRRGRLMHNSAVEIEGGLYFFGEDDQPNHFIAWSSNREGIFVCFIGIHTKINIPNSPYACISHDPSQQRTVLTIKNLELTTEDLQDLARNFRAPNSGIFPLRFEQVIRAIKGINLDFRGNKKN